MGLLIMSKYGRYENEDAVENVVRYITRTRPGENRKDELIAYGAMGVSAYAEPEIMIQQMKYVQNFYEIERKKGARIYHEFYRFDEREQSILGNNIVYLQQIALQCCNVYYERGYQVIYAVHYDREKRLHIHFCVNAVSFVNGNKWHEYMNGLSQRQALFNGIAKKYMNIISPIEFER